MILKNSPSVLVTQWPSPSLSQIEGEQVYSYS